MWSPESVVVGFEKHVANGADSFLGARAAARRNRVHTSIDYVESERLSVTAIARETVKSR